MVSHKECRFCHQAAEVILVSAKPSATLPVCLPCKTNRLSRASENAPSYLTSIHEGLGYPIWNDGNEDWIENLDDGEGRK